MTWQQIVIAIPLLLFILYLYLIAPGKRLQSNAEALLGKLYAHRGLHDGNNHVYENSLLAFRLAAEAGYGIELDVQLTADHVLVVHHDATTGRLCGVDVSIRETPYDALPALPDSSPIPTLAQVLELVDGRVPLIVEIKPYGSPSANAAAALAALKGYAGAFCVESFHPMAVCYCKHNAPHILRGQLSMGGKRDAQEVNLLTHIALKYLLVNVLSRPHFVAYHSQSDHNLSMWLMKRLFRPTLVAWTLRSQAALDQARKDYQMNIFELFKPT